MSASMAILTAVVAVIALLHTARDSSERSRPMLLAEFRAAKNSHSAIDLVIRNAGPSVAHDVVVSFDPMPVVPDDGKRYVTTYLLKRYSQPLAVVVPGQELSNIWFSGEVAPDGDAELINREPTPDQVVVAIAYRGAGRRMFSETFRLDVDVVRMTTYSTSSDSFPGRMASISKSMKSLEKAADTIAKAANFVRREEIAAEAAGREAAIEAMRRKNAKGT